MKASARELGAAFYDVTDESGQQQGPCYWSDL